jgi:hypothetical protein
MPKAAVHEDQFLARREHDVGFAREIQSMQAVAISKRREDSPND